MIGRFAWMLFACLLFCQCSPDNPVSPSLPDQDVEAYEVYSAILTAELPPEATWGTNLVIQVETGGWNTCLEPDSLWEATMRPAIVDYVQKNPAPWLRHGRFQIARPYQLVPSDTLESIFKRGGIIGGWETFYRLYPGSSGYLTLSAVGFNPEKTVAVVYMGHFCGPLCGSGWFRILEKKDGGWSPLPWRGRDCAWISRRTGTPCPER